MARAYFDSVLESYPDLDQRLASDAKNFEGSGFEEGIVEIQEGREVYLTTSEKRALPELLVQIFCNLDAEEENGSIIQRALKKLRSGEKKKQPAFLDARFLLPTSILCKRLFSSADDALTNRRKGTLPANLESWLFLFVHRNFGA